jgi:hypothetical protein
MKSLGKLKINSGKMLNYEELINLKGGYGPTGECKAQQGQCNTGNCVIDDGEGHRYDGTCGEVEIGGTTLCACIQN